MDFGRVLKMLPLPAVVTWFVPVAFNITMLLILAVLVIIFKFSLPADFFANTSSPALLGMGVLAFAIGCIFIFIGQILLEFGLGWWTGRHLVKAHSATQTEAIAVGVGIYVIGLIVNIILNLLFSGIVPLILKAIGFPSLPPAQASGDLGTTLIAILIEIFWNALWMGILLAGILFGHRRATQSQSSGMVVIGGGPAPITVSPTTTSYSGGDWVSGGKSSGKSARKIKEPKRKKPEPPSGW